MGAPFLPTVYSLVDSPCSCSGFAGHQVLPLLKVMMGHPFLPTVQVPRCAEFSLNSLSLKVYNTGFVIAFLFVSSCDCGV